MRNLLGRLHARPPGELAQIAAFWQVPAAVDDRHGQVGALYRALSDPRAARSAWDRLGADERAMVRLLALDAATEGAPTLIELSARLGMAETAARETAVHLYRVGILAREGDDEPLPVGATPRLFLPRELALLFRRVQDEIEAGDLSGTPLRALLELLDDAEIEEAATIWGLRVVPGLRRREDLTRQLLRQVGDIGRVASVAAARRRDAARLWRLVRDAPDGAPVPFAAAAADVGLGGDDRRTGARLRAALAELETSLLVWHSYRSDGSRWLFVPAEIRAPRPPAAPELPPLAPIAEPALETPPWRHPDALAWDLLTLLRELSDPDASPWPATADPPRARLRRLNRRFWHRGEDVPPPGYLDFLIALAVAEGLLLRRGDDHQPTLTVTPGTRAWRDRSFPAQTERLRWWWQASPDWIEGRARGEVEVWGADWRGARRKLLALLADPAIGLEPGVWYALDSVAMRLATHDSALLGATFTAATARLGKGGGHGDEDETGRIVAIAAVVGIAATTALAWFGLVEVTDIPGHARAVRLTGAIAAARAGAPRLPDPAVAADGPPLVVTPAGEIALRQPTPLRVWSLSAFADSERLGPVSIYRLAADPLARALAAGFDLAQVTAFLTRQGGVPLPPAVAARLEDWARGYRRVRLQRAIVLTPDEPATIADLGRLAAEAGLPTRPLGDDSLLVELPSADGDGDHPEETVLALLRTGGYSPQWSKTAAKTGADGVPRPRAMGSPCRLASGPESDDGLPRRR